MADVNARIRLMLEDTASKSLKSFRKTVSATQSSVVKFARAGGSALKSFGGFMLGLNQTLEVFTKIRDGFAAVTEQSMKFRSENDEFTKSTQAALRDLDVLFARIVEPLGQVFTALVTAMKPAIKAVTKFLAENQALIATGIVRFLERMALILVGGVAKGFVVVSRVAFGVNTILNLVKESAFMMFKTIMDNVAKAARALERLNFQLGLKGVAGKFEDIALKSEKSSRKMQKGIRDVRARLDELIENQINYEQTVADTAESVKSFITNSLVPAYKMTTKAVAGTTRTTEELSTAQQQASQVAVSGIQKMTESMQSYGMTLEEIREKERLLQEERNTSAALSSQEMGTRFGEALVAGFESAEEGQSKYMASFRAAHGELMMMSLEFMRNEVMNAAMAAAAKAASASALFGPLAAGAAAAVMFALVKSQMGKFQGMADGGIVTGGTPGRDSVPTMLMPGEMVLSVDDVDRIRQGGGLGGQNVTIVLNSSMPQNKAEVKKFLRQNVVPALRDLKAQRMF